MSYALIGALVGLAFAVVEYFVFGVLITKTVDRGEQGSGPQILDWIRKGQLVLFPVIGWFAGPFLAQAMGGTQ